MKRLSIISRKKRAQSEMFPQLVFGVPLEKSSNIPWIMKACMEYLIDTDGRYNYL